MLPYTEPKPNCQSCSNVEAGEEIIIARGDKQIAKLSPAGITEVKKRVPGSMKHLLGKIPDSLFDPLSEEELKLWEEGN